MSCLQEKLPREVSDRLASRIDNSASASSELREEILSLKASVEDYRESQSSLRQDLMIAMNQDSRAVEALRVQLERLPLEISENFELKESPKDPVINQNSATNRLEEMMVEQSNDLKIIHGSITTLTEYRTEPWSNKSREAALTSQDAFRELKSTFCKW